MILQFFLQFVLNFDCFQRSIGATKLCNVAANLPIRFFVVRHDQFLTKSEESAFAVLAYIASS